MARSFDGRRVSDSWFHVLTAARRAGVHFRLNSGQRTMAEQQRLRDLYEAGIGALAAIPSPSAPHIRVGREDHALDVDMHVDDGVDGLMGWLRKHDLPTALTVPGEGWHIEAIDERLLVAAARRLKRPLTALDRLRARPLRRGTKSPDVKSVQVYLKRAGLWRGKPAKKVGSYGPHLVEAVKTFQKRVGLTPDGIVGPKTFAAMRRRYGWKVWQRRREPKPRAPSRPARPAELRISAEGLALIEEFEGWVNDGRPYNDPVGHATVGYGHLLHHGNVTDADRNAVWVAGQARRGQLTRAEARHLLRTEIAARYEPAVTALRLPLTQGQHDALVSFVFNLGPGAIGADTGIGRALRVRNWQQAADELLRWDKAGVPPRPFAGLTRRRGAERALFLKETR